MMQIPLPRALAATLLSPLAAAALLCACPAAADDPEVIRRLRSEPVTIFDAGLKRLRRAAIDASGRLQGAPGSGPLTRVWYEANDGTIEIEFRFIVGAETMAQQTKARCEERRRAAIRETFDVGKTIYAVPLSFDERVRRRLANFFILEPVDSVKQVIALGQSLARLTFLRVRLAGEKDAFAVSCRSPVAPEVGGR